MKYQEHKKRHEELHKALDELVADYITHHQDSRLTGTTVMQLMEWSFKQTISPDL